MKASVFNRYGPPEVLEIDDLPKPVPQDNEVLVRIRASSATAADVALRSGVPFLARFATGITKPRQRVLGSEFAGEVEAVGSRVTRWRPGDRVVAASGAGFGGHAEYICIDEAGGLALKPEALRFEEAVAVCEGALTALPFLRDKAKVASGHKVLVNGASGAVGTAAVQLARHFGAEVTAVCSDANAALVTSLGAHHVIDYAKEDFTRAPEAYDVVFDTVGKSSFAACKSALKPGGVYLSTVLGPRILLQTLWTSRLGDKKAVITFTGLRPPADKARDLEYITGLAKSGDLKPVIDRIYPLDQAPEAYRYIESGHKKGAVVLTV